VAVTETQSVPASPSPRAASAAGGVLVAYQGEAGAYSEEGVHTLWPSAEHVPVASIRKVFEAVEVGRVDYGLVPIDNSQAGSINETYDLFLKHGLHLIGEAIVRIDHCVAALPNSSLDDLTEIISHPQAIAQCEEFLTALGISLRADYDTAGAAKRIADEKLEFTGAIASRRAADLYGLRVLAERIQTYPDNYTRFGALSRNPSALREPDKSSLVFGVSHVAGSLYRCLGAFAERHLNLAKLESRPRAGRPWEYVMHIDVEAAANQPEMVAALAEVSEHATFTRLLGSYASALTRRRL
jgi:prephenate dehydratase